LVDEAAVSMADPSARLTSAILAASWPSEGKVRGDVLDPCNEVVLELGTVRRLAPIVIGAAWMLPLADRTVVVVRIDFGNLMFWDASRPVPAWKLPAGEVFWYHPLSAVAYGITAHPFVPTKVTTPSSIALPSFLMGVVSLVLSICGSRL
jgi:hypothetical protein